MSVKLDSVEVVDGKNCTTRIGIHSERKLFRLLGLSVTNKVKMKNGAVLLKYCENVRFVMVGGEPANVDGW